MDFKEISWMRQAKCRGMNTDLWYPTNGKLDPKVIDACGSCPVRAECLDHAIHFNEAHGVWGGLRERERQRMRRAKRSRTGVGAR